MNNNTVSNERSNDCHIRNNLIFKMRPYSSNNSEIYCITKNHYMGTLSTYVVTQITSNWLNFWTWILIFYYYNLLQVYLHMSFMLPWSYLREDEHKTRNDNCMILFWKLRRVHERSTTPFMYVWRTMSYSQSFHY